MSSLTKILKKGNKLLKKIDPIGHKIRENLQDLPGSSGSLQAAIESDQPSDPFGPQQSKFDIFAGGQKMSESKRARNVGRAVGTVAALYFGAGAFGGGETAAAGGGAATAGSAAGGTAAAGGGITTGQALTAAQVGLTAQGIAEQRKAAKAAEEAAAAQGAAFTESLAALKRDAPQTPTIDEARRRAEQADAQRRKKGRRASILTGNEGVGATPISQRTLLGS